jgi:hypothetical protein
MPTISPATPETAATHGCTVAAGEDEEALLRHAIHQIFTCG